MAKLTRIFQNLFGSSGDVAHFGQFGSRAVGAPFTTKDPNSIQALSAFLQNGWLDAINAANKAPFLEDMNGMFYLLFYQICYGMQEGIPEWNAATTYFTGSIVKKAGTTELYGSAVDNNLGNALPSQTSNGNWNYLNPQTVAPGVITDFGGTSAPFGWLACDGSVIAQASFPALFSAIGANWNTGGEGAGNFRLPDLRGRATVGAGSGSGLSPRTVGQTFGEEQHVLTTPELAAHNHGVTDPGHVHAEIGTPGAPTAGTISLVAFTSAQSRVIADNTQSAPTGISINNAGGGGGHNNIQPSGVALKIIKT